MPAWGTAERIDSDSAPSVTAQDPDLAVASNGSAFVVWSRTHPKDASGDGIGVNHYVLGQGWAGPESLGAGTTGLSPRLAANRQGDAVVLWQAIGDDGRDLWSDLYGPDHGWGAPQPLQAGVADLAADVGIDDAGRAVALWRAEQGQGTAATAAIWSSAYAPGVGWDAPAVLDGAAHGSQPLLAVNGAGLGIATWGRDGAPADVVAPFDATQGFGAAEPIDFAPLALAMNHGGEAVALSRSDGTLWVHHYAQGAGFGIPEAVQAQGGGIILADHVAINDEGTVVAAWALVTNGVQYSVWANVYTNAGGWAGATQMDGGEPYTYAHSADIGIDAAGNVLVVWQYDVQTGGPLGPVLSTVWARRYVPAVGWGAPVALDPDANTGPQQRPRVAIDGAGRAVAIWQQSGGIWANRFE